MPLPRPAAMPASSPAAIARVKNSIAAPDSCPHCASPVEIVNNSAIYGTEYGTWPWTYRCINVRGCGAYVGMHPQTDIPLGTLATAPLREARKKAKNLFNPLWQGGPLSRSAAYSWLAHAMGIPPASCHFGWFDIRQCEQAIAVLQRRAERIASK